jgi:tRNA A-37 threonylcarbamoyl transferase component Bud32
VLGETVRGFRVLRELGRGAHSTVYLGTHAFLDTSCAIKVLHPQLSDNPTVRRRLLLEAQAIASLKHPNVVEILNFGESDSGRLCLILEYLEGRTLHEVIAREAPLAEARIRFLGAQLASGLAAIHAAGFVHRDLKPSNIMVLAHGGIEQVKILDLGLVRLVDQAELTRLTRTGIKLGTPSFMAPEQKAGDEVTTAADCWALGKILAAMAKDTGALEPVIDRLRARNPAKRPSALEAIALLSSAQKPRRRSLLPAMLAAATLMVGVAIMLPKPAPPPNAPAPIAPPSPPPASVSATPRPIEEAPQPIKKIARKAHPAPRTIEVREKPAPPPESIEVRLDRALASLRELGTHADPTTVRVLEVRYLELRKRVSQDPEPTAERMLEVEDLERRIARARSDRK